MLGNGWKIILLLWVQVLLGAPARAQPGGGLWTPAAGPGSPGPAARGSEAPPARWCTLDAPRLAARLAAAPPETRPADAVPVELPYPDGTVHRFALTQVPVMALALAARYPQIQTYAARALDEPGTTARVEWTPAGLHAQVLTPAGCCARRPCPPAAPCSWRCPPCRRACTWCAPPASRAGWKSIRNEE